METLTDVDLSVEEDKPVEIGLMVAFPRGARVHPGRDICQLSLDGDEHVVVALDIAFEPDDAALDLSALGSVGAASEGAKVVKFLAGEVKSPLGAVPVGLLPRDGVGQPAVIPPRIGRAITESATKFIALVTKLGECRDSRPLDLVECHLFAAVAADGGA